MTYIAYVDDEPMICRIIQFRLAILGVEVRTWTDPVEALEAMRETPPAVVVSDYRMPRLTGLDLMEKLEGVPFIIVTGGGTIDDPRCEDPRVKALLLKPLDFDDLLQRVNQLVEEG